MVRRHCLSSGKPCRGLHGRGLSWGPCLPPRGFSYSIGSVHVDAGAGHGVAEQRSFPYRKLFRKKIPTNRDHERERQKEQEGDEKAAILERKGGFFRPHIRARRGGRVGLQNTRRTLWR